MSTMPPFRRENFRPNPPLPGGWKPGRAKDHARKRRKAWLRAGDGFLLEARSALPADPVLALGAYVMWMANNTIRPSTDRSVKPVMAPPRKPRKPDPRPRTTGKKRRPHARETFAPNPRITGTERPTTSAMYDRQRKQAWVWASEFYLTEVRAKLPADSTDALHAFVGWLADHGYNARS